MQKIFIPIIALFLFAAIFVSEKYIFRQKHPPILAKNTPQSAPQNPTERNSPSVDSGQTAPNSQDLQNLPADKQAPSGFQAPLDRAKERVAKKPFGIFITPQSSPVQPEKFRGYHTGMDFETFPEEQSADVLIRAICSGKIAVKRFASGYGGVLVQNCNLNNQTITVVYGHLKLASIAKNAGDNLNAGDEIGILGKANSSETDGERKHLHLGIHKGGAINILGYVGSKSELSGWIDACSLVCK